MGVWDHAGLQRNSTRCLRGQSLNVWSCARTLAVAAVGQIHILGDCFLDDKVGKHHHVDTGTRVRGKPRGSRSRGLTGATTWQPRTSQSTVSGSSISLAPMSSRNCLARVTHSNPADVLWSIMTYVRILVDRSGLEMFSELRTMV